MFKFDSVKSFNQGRRRRRREDSSGSSSNNSRGREKTWNVCSEKMKKRNKTT